MSQPTLSAETLTPLTPGVFTIARPLRFFGVEMGSRMTVLVQGDGGLIVHSPVALDAPLRAAIDGLGDVRAIVAPTLFHHLFVGPWHEAYPHAALWCCPGLENKRSDLAWTGVLGDDVRSPLGDEIEHVVFGARSIENEAVLYHRPSKTIVSADLIFEFGAFPSRVTRTIGALLGNDGPGATWLERLTIRDRPRARREVDRMLAWEADRLIIAHGNVVHEEATPVLERAYAFL